jgi:hypothetical protein
MASSHRTGGPAPRGRLEAAGIVLIAGAIIWFYALLATSHSATPFTFEARGTDYYHYQVEGFMAGQTALSIQPEPELATLADPYDPQARVKIGHPGLADASYYKGRYYLYFGVSPTLAVFLPFRLLTGVHPSETLVSAFFCAGGFLISVALYLGIRRRYFLAQGVLTAWLGVLMLGMGNLCAMMLTRAGFYEVPIAGAYFFSMICLWSLTKYAWNPSGPRAWLWLAGLAMGLTIASRPPFVFAASGIGLVLLGRWWMAKGLGGAWISAMVKDAMAAFLPIGVCVAGLLVYNALRFDSPLEFGQRYQLGGSNVGKMTLMTLQSVPVNFYYYFWAPAEWGRYFPFVGIVRTYPGTAPASYYGVEDPFGLLTNLPCLWLALAAPTFWWWRREVRDELGRLLLLLLGFFVPVCGFLMLFVSATNRYMVDFLPSLSLIAGLGMLLVAGVPLAGRGWRWLRGMVLGGLVGFSVFFSAMAAFQHNGLFQHHQPAFFDRVGRWFNLPAAAWEAATGREYGPVELKVQFSRDNLGANEPLLVTGSGVLADFVHVFYTGPDSIQIGFMHAGDVGGFLSAPIPLDYDIPHVIGIQAGSLYPPASHPMFWGETDDAVRAKKRRLFVTVDGVPYVDLVRNFHEAAPNLVSFGRNHVSEYAGRLFRGKILQVRRQPMPELPGNFGGNAFVRLGIEFPKGTAGRQEVLVSTGSAGAGDVIFVAFESETSVRLGFGHAGSPPLLSEPLTILPDQVQRLELGMGSFFAGANAPVPPPLAGALMVKLNDRLLWMERTAFHPAGTAPMFGRLAWSAREGDPQNFSGRIVSIQAVEPPAMPPPAAYEFQRYWLARDRPAYGPLRLHVRFPRDQTGKFEPLLVAGRSVSEADYVWVQYVDAGRIVLGYESTGGGGPREVVPLDFEKTHVVEIEIPALFPAVTAALAAGESPFEAGTAKNRGRFSVDGSVRMDARVKGFPATPEQATPGENRLSTTFGQRFTGRILQVETGTKAMPPGFLAEKGPLEISLRFPVDAVVGQKELLLASGTPDAKDRLFVVYEGPARARLVFEDHQGDVIEGSPFDFVASASRALLVQWGAFGGTGNPRQVRVEADGNVLLGGEAVFRDARPLAVWLGGGVPGLPGFTGVLQEIRRLPAR